MHLSLQTSGASLSETEEMVKVFEETKHALLYPVVIVQVSIYTQHRLFNRCCRFVVIDLKYYISHKFY